MMRVADLFADQPLQGEAVDSVVGLCRDGRRVVPGMAFVAAGGDVAANRRQAEAAGAVMIVAESGDGRVPTLRTPHARFSAAQALARAHGLHTSAIPLIAATGTKGKSTTVWAAWWALGTGAARVGTVGWHDGTGERPSTQTTPPPEELHAFLAGLSTTCPGLALEASSHAGDQHRLAGLTFQVLVATGIERDHLDYHGSMARYVAAKLELVHQLRPGGTIIVNADDLRAAAFIHAGRCARARVITLGFRRGDSRLRHDGQVWRLHHEGSDLVVPDVLIGRFNVFNLAAGALAAAAAGVPLPTALARLRDLPPIPGRMEPCGTSPLTYVDYAHTARSLALVVEALRETHPGRRLVVVFGCGGDRDPGKRGPMGRAAMGADVAVVTNDNPRSESGADIAGQIIAGTGAEAHWHRAGQAVPADARLVVELDRAAAIRLARDLAGTDGVVAVCGKGHETEQIFADHREHFDDRAVVRGLEGGA